MDDTRTEETAAQQTARLARCRELARAVGRQVAELVTLYDRGPLERSGAAELREFLHDWQLVQSRIERTAGRLAGPEEAHGG